MDTTFTVDSRYSVVRAAASSASSVLAGPNCVLPQVTTPTVRECVDASCLAAKLRRYFSSSTAAITRSCVSGRTPGIPLSTRETVWCDTPARAATSAIRGTRGRSRDIGHMPHRVATPVWDVNAHIAAADGSAARHRHRVAGPVLERL